MAEGENNVDEIPLAAVVPPENPSAEQSPYSPPIIDYRTADPKPFSSEGRAWRRYGARSLDSVVLNLPAAIVLAVLLKGGILHHDAVTPSGAYFVRIFLIAAVEALIISLIEAVILSHWGTTPGKWMLRMGVVGSNDAPPELGQSFKRALLIFAGVYVFGIPFASLIGMLTAYFKFRKAHVTWYDVRCGTTVVYQHLSGGRIVAFFAVLIAATAVSYGINSL